ncbi:carbohydrate kinase [Cryobacterium frigoriphilum]|uniref:Carbohydrate kinase n=1 Tax=Cryobacterium frigoriphilum TaxID=1259150 RepID=A0A4R9ABJ9_9MICO|nr:carbohydrate kinase [Cryobacterium frigoriphilum]TFD55558.1 carbohydrate kinase [Cryobacterium frigoriphilum]
MPLNPAALTPDAPRPAAPPPAELIVVGEALVDVVTTATGSVDYPGGSPMNVAIGLARLEHPVQLVTRIGSDLRGAALQRHIEQSGVALFPGSLRDEATSTATALLDSAGVASYDFNIHWSLDFVEHLPTTPLLHLGSIAAFLEPGATDARRLLSEAARSSGGAGTIVTFDPNIRPSLLDSHADAVATVEDLAALSTVVKLSDEDARWLYPTLTVDAVLDHLLTFGPALVIATLGGDGALLATAAGERVAVNGVAVEVADTIGAGDSFMSGVIHHLARLLETGTAPGALRDGSVFTRAELLRAGSFAVRCAGITVSRTGANPPTLAELNTQHGDSVAN